MGEHRDCRKPTLAVMAAAVVIAGTGSAAAQNAPQPDGTVRLDGVSVPLSDFLSAEAREYVRHLIVDKPFGTSAPDIKAERTRQDGIMLGFLKPMLQRYPVKITEETIGGVFTQVVTPAGGVRPENQKRVLLNVHGGGFSTGARTASLVESVPLAAVMGIKVVSIDYRMGPEFKFPAGSEDVAAVYKKILETYEPSQVGLYGCSAGGMLTGQALAWFQSHDLPRPGAAGIFCASLGAMLAGDSARLAGPLNGAEALPTPPAAAKGAPPRGPSYLADASPTDPTAYPIASTTVMSKFPPTLFVTATRAFEFSSALNSHNQLSKSGAPSKFFAWDGLFHGFFYNSELPESREAYDVMAKFFDTHLSK